MEITSVANQALYLREQTTNQQLGLAALKQSADAESQIAEMIAKNSATIAPAGQSEKSGFSTYA